MNKLLLKVVIAGSLLSMCPVTAQVSPTTPKARQVRIIQGPEPESANEYLTIIRWTTNNPGGSPMHYGIVHYGTDPSTLDQIAKNPIRLNSSHNSTVFRVRIEGLKVGTTYYYTVESEEANGTNDNVKSSIKQFTVGPVPRPGSR